MLRSKLGVPVGGELALAETVKDDGRIDQKAEEDDPCGVISTEQSG